MFNLKLSFSDIGSIWGDIVLNMPCLQFGDNLVAQLQQGPCCALLVASRPQCMIFACVIRSA